MTFILTGLIYAVLSAAIYIELMTEAHACFGKPAIILEEENNLYQQDTDTESKSWIVGISISSIGYIRFGDYL